jgi:hypothetical protein
MYNREVRFIIQIHTPAKGKVPDRLLTILYNT